MKATGLARSVIVPLFAGIAAYTGIRVAQSPAGASPDDSLARMISEQWSEIEQGATPVRESSAQLNVVEFSDFQCPFCAESSEILHRLVSENGNELGLRLRHYPLTAIHPHAFAAAHAAECAAAQGRVAEFSRVLFTRQREIGTVEWEEFAGDAGVSDLERFSQCQDGQTYASRITADIALGRQLGVRGTPTVAVDGHLVEGPPSEGAFRAAIKEAVVRRQGRR